LARSGNARTSQVPGDRVNRAALPDWPRLMGEDMAAAYVSLSATTLRERGPEPRRLGKRRLYDRNDLDRWADRLGGQPLTVQEQVAEASEVERRFLEKRRARG
jgi:hypothetical protein